jgi:hypothetical protein
MLFSEYLNYCINDQHILKHVDLLLSNGLLLIKINKKDTSQHFRKFYIKLDTVKLDTKVDNTIKLCWKSGRIVKTEKAIDIKNIYDIRYLEEEKKISIFYTKKYYNYSNLTIVMPNKDQMYIMLCVLNHLISYCKLLD